MEWFSSSLSSFTSSWNFLYTKCTTWLSTNTFGKDRSSFLCSSSWHWAPGLASRMIQMPWNCFGLLHSRQHFYLSYTSTVSVVTLFIVTIGIRTFSPKWASYNTTVIELSTMRRPTGLRFCSRPICSVGNPMLETASTSQTLRSNWKISRIVTWKRILTLKYSRKTYAQL